jgi:hypothetical protein
MEGNQVTITHSPPASGTGQESSINGKHSTTHFDLATTVRTRGQQSLRVAICQSLPNYTWLKELRSCLQGRCAGPGPASRHLLLLSLK